MSKFKLYLNTLRYMRLSQIFFRLAKLIKKRLNIHGGLNAFSVPQIFTSEKYIVEILDFDSSYLARFDTEEILDDVFTFLNEKKKININTAWNDAAISQLWRYNLNYFEYVYPLYNKYKNTKDKRYYIKFKQLICAWIDSNNIENGDGWHPYTISLRLVNWICGYQLFERIIQEDFEFRLKFLSSVYKQYTFLQNNLEKDVLGNHYFENIKAIILASIFFQQSGVLARFVNELKIQLREQVLEDGMHFELSPMYHKIIFEDLLKIGYWLSFTQYSEANKEIVIYIKKMVDCIYSLETGMGKTPFFNDSGNNVSKDISCLILSAEKLFSVKPSFKNVFKESGYYVLVNKNMKLIVDCGSICPDYLPAHGHCDTLSYELSIEGRPFLVNSGTFEYRKGRWRDFFRSTKAHNTLVIDHKEQAQFWGSFRIAKRTSANRGKISIVEGQTFFSGSFRNYSKIFHERHIGFVYEDVLLVLDKVESKKVIDIFSYIHFHPDLFITKCDYPEIWSRNVKNATVYPLNCEFQRIYYGEDENGWYAPEFGYKLKNSVLEIKSDTRIPFIGYTIDFSNKGVKFAIDDKHLVLEHEGIKKNIKLEELFW